MCLDAESAADILHRLPASAGDAELLKLASWACSDAQRAELIRSRWPTQQVPIIGDYFCVQKLGQGASGAVFKAFSPKVGPRFVAIKLLQSASAQESERFREREIEILKALTCPNVARYLDSGQQGGMTYLVMDLVEGLPLDEYLNQNCGESLEQKLNIFRRACEAVAHLHDQSVIHRDLKPKHILVDKESNPWIVDFGLSAVSGEDWPTRVREARTELGNVIGTVKYMSPEQAWGGLMGIDYRSDIWSLGVMLYEIATEGDYPYSLEPLGELVGSDALLHRIQAELPRNPRIRSAEHAGDVSVLISRCLAYDPEHRIGSASLLASDLGKSLARQSIETTRLPLRYRAERLAIGLANQARTAMWLATVGGILLFLLIYTTLFGVRMVAVTESARRASTATPAVPVAEFAIVGISDATVEAVPPLAATLGFSGVTADVRSWRGLHGRLMTALAEAKPSLVIWDYYFASPQEADHEFVRGAKALMKADIELVLTTSELGDEGVPRLSPAIYGQLSAKCHVGLIAARDMVARPGEFLMALARGGSVYPSVTLAAYAAAVHPDCRLGIEWNGISKSIRLIFDPRDDRLVLPSELFELTELQITRQEREGTLPEDHLGFRGVELEEPTYWEARTIAYEGLLADDQELLASLAGKIVVIGDLRSKGFWRRHDRHNVRFGARIIHDVPGCYLLADGVRGLLRQEYLASPVPFSSGAYVAVVLVAFLSCVAAPRLVAKGGLKDAVAQRRATFALIGGAAICLIAMVFTRASFGIYAAILASALCLALAVSFQIEFTRNRHRWIARSDLDAS